MLYLYLFLFYRLFLFVCFFVCILIVFYYKIIKMVDLMSFVKYFSKLNELGEEVVEFLVTGI